MKGQWLGDVLHDVFYQKKLISELVMAKIIYTYTDEAPMLATYSLLPVFQRFARPMGITIEKKDISVAGRILSYFPDYLTPEQVATPLAQTSAFI